jgi:hypothetical protein
VSWCGPLAKLDRKAETNVIVTQETVAAAGAEYIVDILTGPPPLWNLRPGGAVPEEQVRSLFTCSGEWDADEYDPNIRYAEQQGWVTRNHGRVQLTKLGYEVGTSRWEAEMRRRSGQLG